jgi:hypothetical protein
MSKIIVGFSKPNGGFKPAAWAIMLWQKTPYSHVYIKIPRPSGVDVVYQASGKAVNFMGMKAFATHAKVVTEFEFEIDSEVKDKFFDWAIENSGAPYSVIKGLGIAIARCFDYNKNFFKKDGEFVCSILAGFFFKKFLGQELTEDEINISAPKEIYAICKKLQAVK